ncbi:MAG: hypothetical protein GF308_03765 [Candidatus Heimdallarchaeota archaeon]|nr:hypothetical protein [Candidatus Heimdallarchaeota archaeon]
MPGMKEKLDRSEAILKKKRNTRQGLKMRNKILKYLFEAETHRATAPEIAENIDESYRVVTYHLSNMLQEKVVEKEKHSHINIWKITGLGQQTIRKWIEQNSKKD